MADSLKLAEMSGKTEVELIKIIWLTPCNKASLTIQKSIEFFTSCDELYFNKYIKILLKFLLGVSFFGDVYYIVLLCDLLK